MSVSLDQVPANAMTAWLRVRDELRMILGEDLVALWGYGARAFPDPPHLLGDVDTLGVVNPAPREGMARLIRDTVEGIGRDVGIAVDLRFILLGDASRSELPRNALPPDTSFDVSWPFLRAHVLAGRYVLLHGKHADDIVQAPTWPELDAALREELEHLERHVAAGDDDLYEAAYAMLNGSRLLYNIETRDVVVSKRAAGAWATQHLPDRWHEAVRAASRAYDGDATPDDIETLRTAMAPFVDLVRRRLSYADDDRSAQSPGSRG